MSQSYQRNPRTASRTYGDNALVITIDDRRVHKLNETATVIWEELKGRTMTLNSMVDVLCHEFECERESADRGARELVSSMLTLGLVDAGKSGEMDLDT